MKKNNFKPSYFQDFETNVLVKKIEKLYKILESCELCPRKCRVNRMEGEKGICNSGKNIEISSYNPHFGEEEPLVGKRNQIVMSWFGSTGGSGTIFLTGCSLLCVYCQNYDISHLHHGKKVSLERTAEMMIELQNKGCYNINFVSPTHFAPQLINATKLAIEKGLKIPLVWNCSGYENVDIIKILEGIVDIYMPDIKYGESELANKFSKVQSPDYIISCKEAVKEMHRQVGDLKLDERGIAYRGLLIRHLVLPNNLVSSKKVLQFIADEISKNSYVNVMSQYRPEGEAFKYDELNRKPTIEEYYSVVATAKKLGLTRGLQRKYLGRFVP
jgi:putative pyruvate formate lyase activating enzyme